MNERYYYLQAIKDDVREYIKENEVPEKWYREDFETHLYETLWVEDSVTGNASGSYTFSTWKAEKYVGQNLDLLFEALEEFSELDRSAKYLRDKGAEWADVTIRCYLLSQAISEVLDEIECNMKGVESK